MLTQIKLVWWMMSICYIILFEVFHNFEVYNYFF